MSDVLFCPGIRTMSGFCPEVEEADDGGRLVCLYRSLKDAEKSIALDAREWARQVVEDERPWHDAKSMIDSLSIVVVEIDDSDHAAIAYCLTPEGEIDQGLPEEIDYGYLETEPENPEDGWLADEDGYIIEGEES